MKFLAFLSLFLSSLIFMPNAEAGFSNNGKMQAAHLNLSAGGTLDNNGELIGTQTATLSCDTFTGKGLLSAPQITIKTNIFAYTGKIDCSGKCTIIANSLFDEKMFQRSGGGEFIIIIDENPVTKSTKQAYTITDGLFMNVEDN